MQKYLLPLTMLILTLFLSIPVFSQSISNIMVNGNKFCENDIFSVSYAVSGNFLNDNVFIAQLSKNDGSFSSFTNIGNVKNTNSGTISCTLPSNIINDNRYRIRVISSNPYVVSPDNGIDISLSLLPKPDFKVDSSNIFHIRNILVGQPVTFTNISSDSADYFWDFGDGAVPKNFQGYTPPAVAYYTPGC